ncbi:Aste57867_18624 [Aphanomyces stellatus]|uniref:Phosphatidylserine decarboxylase proenzyme, mitochondrial n=1 Tax=Aphanomyces stellatus TaxID=120398 RepID=A0A485LAM4_9STRA|nr:hypothetical protein As57867_018562 [Aphanomyces stellatus]VFT95359.1 Aste57867_18624 [Aphanomyces stellatus]
MALFRPNVEGAVKLLWYLQLPSQTSSIIPYRMVSTHMRRRLRWRPPLLQSQTHTTAFTPLGYLYNGAIETVANVTLGRRRRRLISKMVASSMQKKDSKHPAKVFTRLPGEKTEAEARLRSRTTMIPLNVLPYRFISRLWGAANDINLPHCLREPVYHAWTLAFGCQLDEMKHPLRDYKNLGEFFSRQLKDGVRPVDDDITCICSPVDGRLSTVGTVDYTDAIPVLEQIKGVRYRMDEFLGDVPEFFKSPPRPGTKLFHCVIYLAPGDYHRIHSPVDWTLRERRHFPGNLFPVNRLAVHTVPSLFTWNERVALLGGWEHGFFALTAVGATNVGSILLDVEPELTTNKFSDHHKVRPKWGACYANVYPQPHAIARGAQVGQFKLGSTVVLVFEAPADFEFAVAPGDKVRYGQALGRFRTPPSSSDESGVDASRPSTDKDVVDVSQFSLDDKATAAKDGSDARLASTTTDSAADKRSAPR